MITAILDFWFGQPADDVASLKSKMKRWYSAGPALDPEIIERFGAQTQEAVDGGFVDWESSADGKLALILLLDQFTRSVFRNQPRMYAGDARAQQIALEADSKIGVDWHSERRHFLLMPFLHAENLVLQERAVREMAEHVATAPVALRPVYSMGVEQTHKYRAIIERFGRFPHRNAILGRVSTPEEVEFLRDWAEKQAPTGAKDL